MPIRKRWSARRKAPELPKKRGAYELANNRGEIQYIGKADNLARRVQEQLQDPTKARRVAKLRVQEGRNPEALEKRLAKRYQQLHGGKLPPLNERKP